MAYHCKAVSCGVKSSFLVADLPFGTYELSPTQAMESAIKLVRSGRVEAVKLEGGKELVPTVKHLTTFGIPVLGHIGLTPQRQNSLGGFKVQGKTAEDAKRILEDGLALQEAGCFGFVVEAIPDQMAEIITQKLNVPTIGIGAGPGTSGQVLVQLDMLGGFDEFIPKFLKRYSNYLEENVRAIGQYHKEVKEKQFPAQEHCYANNKEEVEKFKELVKDMDKLKKF